MLRKQVPDLDSLESPLISANPFGSILGMVPGSALAERIFNDPHSWQEADDDGELEDAKALKWLADEVCKCQANGEELSLSPVDRDVDIILKSLSEKLNLAATTAPEKPANWGDIAQENKLSFLPLFDHTSLDLNLNLNVDLRFSKIWDAEGKMFNSLQSPIPPANESRTFPSVIENATPAVLDLGAVDNTLSSIGTPLTVASPSTTWSILEFYGVHPDTPCVHGRMPLITHYPPTPYHTKSPALSSLRLEPSYLSANVTVSTPVIPLIPEPTPIRRLPVIPDPDCITSSSTPSGAPTPSRGSTPERIPQRTKSPETPQHVKTLERSAPATTAPNRSPPRRTPRGSAILPVPSGSPDLFTSSSNVPSIRSGNLSTRSPPAGPRPRSGTNPLRQRQASGRNFPSPIVIEPARTRKPSPSPGMYQGVRA